MPAPADRDKALEAALAQIDRSFGKGSVMRLGDEIRAPIEVIPTGSIALDVALGIGGLPRGRVVEVYGPESSGKTTIALHAVASAQRQGGIAAFIDAEHALDPDYAKKLGVDTDALLVSQPDTGEQALEITDMLIRSGALDIIVIDSVAALTPKAEIEGEMGDSHVGLQARLMSQALRKITGALSQSGTTAIFINQLREKIGVFFGSPETTTGGKALKFYASIRLDIRRIETLKEGTDAVGNRTRVKVVKNKMAPPFKQAEFDILYGHGISREGGLIDMGVEHGFVRKSGSWFTYEGDQLGQGKENARAFLRDNPDLANDIEKRVKEKLGVGPKVDAPAAGRGSRCGGSCCHGRHAGCGYRSGGELVLADDRHGEGDQVDPRTVEGHHQAGGVEDRCQGGGGRREGAVLTCSTVIQRMVPAWGSVGAVRPPEGGWAQPRRAQRRRPSATQDRRGAPGGRRDQPGRGRREGTRGGPEDLTAAQRSVASSSSRWPARAYPEDVVVQVLDRFDEVGLVDDATYAETIVRTRHAERGLARGASRRSCAGAASTRTRLSRPWTSSTRTTSGWPVPSWPPSSSPVRAALTAGAGAPCRRLAGPQGLRARSRVRAGSRRARRGGRGAGRRGLVARTEVGHVTGSPAAQVWKGPTEGQVVGSSSCRPPALLSSRTGAGRVRLFHHRAGRQQLGCRYRDRQPSRRCGSTRAGTGDGPPR